MKVKSSWISANVAIVFEKTQIQRMRNSENESHGANLELIHRQLRLWVISKSLYEGSKPCQILPIKACKEKKVLRKFPFPMSF